jgi:hypothetical protein
MTQTIATLVLSTLLLAPGDSVNEDVKPYRGANAEIEVATPMIGQAEIAIDGRLDDAVWQEAALLTDFTLFEPLESGRHFLLHQGMGRCPVRHPRHDVRA